MSKMYSNIFWSVIFLLKKNVPGISLFSDLLVVYYRMFSMFFLKILISDQVMWQQFLYLQSIIRNAADWISEKRETIQVKNVVSQFCTVILGILTIELYDFLLVSGSYFSVTWCTCFQIRSDLKLLIYMCNAVKGGSSSYPYK